MVPLPPFCPFLIKPVGGSIEPRTVLSSDIHKPLKTKHAAPAVILTEAAIRQPSHNYLSNLIKVQMNSA